MDPSYDPLGDAERRRRGGVVWSKRIRFGPFGSALTLAIFFGVFTLALVITGLALLGVEGGAVSWPLLGVGALFLAITIIAVVHTVRIRAASRPGRKRPPRRTMSPDMKLGILMACLGGGVVVAMGIALVIVALLGGFAES